MSASPATSCSASCGYRPWACVLLVFLLVFAPIAASSAPSGEIPGLAPSAGVLDSPDTRPVVVDRLMWDSFVELDPLDVSETIPLDSKRQYVSESCESSLPAVPAPNSPPSLPPVPEAQSLALPAQISRNASALRATARDGVGALANCRENPPFLLSEVTRFRSVCRVYLFLKSGGIGYCSGTFIEDNMVLTAGHCIAENGKYKIAEFYGCYGTVCCAPAENDKPSSCDPTAEFDIVNRIATNGWLAGRWNNDGAVLKVAPSCRTAPGFGVPVPWGSIATVKPCSCRSFEWDGFPASNDPAFTGCNVNWRGRLRYSDTLQIPNPCPNNAKQIQVIGSICRGQSGGPLWAQPDNIVIGIVSTANPKCNIDGRSWAQFTQIVVEPVNNGVDVQVLIEALS